ncbi:type VI secretion system-associated FHA domain protein TagH [Pseudomonas poae]|uniref:Type VI secretion system-associated FHA domain protein TagH n=1 Tax=Pseudomonas poae TaxID=200451 RepID=A0A2S9EWM4_9PSED|nr:type VI secretion system-associated FHA domain protein TagH [Pseudomonas poae]PRA32073.1 type VI secretion system-associated FHA domain protein TagH [Pseudomonas poae]PRC21014.1 type VI secretion system-associated FHA domain protein TagH [Pseudomonas poae]
MALCLTITSYHKITPGQCPEKSMNQGSMAIGRSSDNDWVLPDPERLVSSQHCVIQYKDGRYYLTDNSTNGVELVNAGIRMRRGNSELLQNGELIRIGDYEIQARIDFNVQAVDSQAFSGDSPNSFEALMGAVASPPPPQPVIAPQFQGASSMDTLPDLFDFLSPTAVPPATVADHVPPEQHDFRPPTPVVAEKPVVSASVIPEDWDLFGDAPAAPVPAPPPPPAPVVQPPPVAEAQSQPDLLQAFLRGAGLDHLRLDAVQAEAQMENIGRSYRLMVEGLIDVLRARASLKGEFRMQQTMIQPAENNPLKFAPNAEEALLLLLRHGNQAFMAPDAAVRDSFNDLRAHQLAVMAGVEAAIKHLLTRFEPAQLEERMGKPGGLSSIFNGSRQAQYWQQFTELYSNISREAQEDFQDLFGREFSRAYEEHSARQRR